MINVLMGITHLYIWRKYSKHKGFLKLLTGVYLSAAIISIALLQLDVMDLGLNGTYGSDETNYYEWMVIISQNKASFLDFPAPLFNLIGSLVLKTSIFESVVLIRLFNTLTYSISLNLLYIQIRERYPDSLSTTKLKLFSIFFAINGIVVWTAIRNLKDIFFISLVVLMSFFLDLVSKKSEQKKRLFGFAICFIIALIVFNLLRPFGWVIAIIVTASNLLLPANKLLSDLKSFLSQYDKRLTISIFLILSMFVVFNFNWRMLIAFRNLIYTPISLDTQGFYVFFFENIRFILGPGPINAFNQIVFGDIFVVSTKFADILIFIGAVQWWALLLFVFYKSILIKKYIFGIIHRSIDYFIFSIFWILTYTYVYGGTGDTRLRAVLYVSAFAYMIPIISHTLNRKKVEL